MKIGLQFAMPAEFHALPGAKELKAFETVSGVPFYEAAPGIIACAGGVSKVNAAMAAEILCLKYGVDMIVNAGVAGCLTELPTGSLVVAEDFVQHDVDTSAIGDPVGLVSTVNRVSFPTWKPERCVELLAALGRKAALMRYDGDAIRAFTKRTHTTDQMVFSSIGNFSAKTAEAVAARYFAGQAASARGFGRVAPAPCAAFEKTVVKHTHQTHCIIGNRAYGIGEEKRLPLALLINILGGPCANSLLNVVVREKNGLSYNIEASYTPYSDSGIVAIYFSSENGNTAQCIDLIEGELHRLRTTPLTARQLSMAKKQFIAQLAISSESNEGYMLGAGKSFLTHDDVDTMEQVYAKVRALTAAQLTEVAEEVFSGMSRLIYK